MIPRFSSRVAVAASFVTLAALVGAGLGCGRPSPDGPNVLLVTLDTTRPDRLGAYGRPEARTPHLDRIARTGALAEFAIGDVPVTLPSHSTIMTGIPALGHGVRYNGDFRLTDDAVTLAEILDDLGWDTGAVISTLVLDEKFGIAQGFDFYEDDLTPGYVKYDESLYPAATHWLPKADRRADETVDRGLAWLGDAARSPWLLWLHFYDPHFPFDPPPPWGAIHPDDRYVGEIGFTDRELGRVVRAMERRGELDSTAIVVTADHGEGLDQHREDGHGIFLYDDTIRVPLIVRAPGRVPPGVVTTQQVRTVDIAPTIFDLVAHPDRAPGLGGSLVPLWTGSGAAPDPAAYSESIKTMLFYSGSGLKALRTRDAKIVWAPRPEFYDLLADPGETVNLWDRERPRGEGLVAELEDRVWEILEADLASVEAANPDAETLEALRSLGYVAGSGGELRPGSPGAEMSLTGYDPKDLVDVSMGAREIQNGFTERGEAKLRRFLATAPTPEEDPRLTRLWAAAHQNLAKVAMTRGEYAAAAEEYRLAMKVDSNYDVARWSRIYALNLAGDPERADLEAEAILAKWPRSHRVRLHRAIALAMTGRSDRARSVLEYVTREADPNGEIVRNARWYLARIGGPDEAEALDSYRNSERRRASRGG